MTLRCTAKLLKRLRLPVERHHTGDGARQLDRSPAVHTVGADRSRRGGAHAPAGPGSSARHGNARPANPRGGPRHARSDRRSCGGIRVELDAMADVAIGRGRGDVMPDEQMLDEYLDCAGKRRRFRLTLSGEGRFLEAVELRDGETRGLRFVPVWFGEMPPWGEMRQRIRERLPPGTRLLRSRVGLFPVQGGSSRRSWGDSVRPGAASG